MSDSDLVIDPYKRSNANASSKRLSESAYNVGVPDIVLSLRQNQRQVK